MSDFLYLLYIIYTIIESSNSQHMPGKKANKSACNDENKASLVEHFFYVIFNELQNNPPVCVCVQMCEDQPTYCYPNGCLKRHDGKKKNSDNIRPPVSIQNDDSTKTMFLVDAMNDFTYALNKADDKKNSQKQTMISRDFSTDPLKDIYKTVFKYKKMPRVELRYNLREQVKNMKSGSVFKLMTDDISKTRWPKSHHRLFHDQRVLTNEKHIGRKHHDRTNVELFPSNLESGQESYNTKYFKRDLRHNQHNYSDHYEMDEDKADFWDNSFSIDKLIDNLVGNSFDDGSNNTGVELKLELYNTGSNFTKMINNTKNSNNEANDDIMGVYSLNLTNQNEDENKYVDDNAVAEVNRKWSNYTFNEMIAALSNQIDMQNNTSMEMIKRNKDFSVTKENSLMNTTITKVDNEMFIATTKESNVSYFYNNKNNSNDLENRNVTEVNMK